jgi:hypothetical protein
MGFRRQSLSFFKFLHDIKQFLNIISASFQLFDISFKLRGSPDCPFQEYKSFRNSSIE